MSTRRIAILLPILALGQSAPAAPAQTLAAADDAILVVRVGGRTIGREEFTLERVADPQGRAGVTLTAVATYPPASPIRTFARFGARRLTVRIATAAGEAAREYPGGRQFLVADDSVLTLLTVAALAPPGSVQFFLPRAGRRVAGRLEDRGSDTVALGDRRLTLRHVVLTIENRAHHLWFDDAGRLMRVTVPDRDLEAERVLP